MLKAPRLIPLHHLHRRLGLSMAGRAVLVGLLAGANASLFRWCLDKLWAWREAAVGGLESWAGGRLWAAAAVAVVAALAAASGVWLVRRFAPEASGSGIPQIECTLDTGMRIRWLRVLLVKFFGGLACVGSGLMLGREGPSIQMGGAWGQLGSAGLGQNHRRLLIAAGAGAGLAAVFNAPLAGMLLIVEELRLRVQVKAMLAGLLACAAGDAVVQMVFGPKPLIDIQMTGQVDLSTLPGMVLVGVAAALLAVVYNRGLMFTIVRLHAWKVLPMPVFAAVIAATIAAAGLFVTGASGEGHDVIEMAVANKDTVALLGGLLVIRLVGMVLSYSCGTVGGIFSPMLALGALLGIVMFHGADALGITGGAQPGLWIAAAIAALFAGVVRAPLTGIVLMLELTLMPNLILPLIVSSGLAYGITNALGVQPIYESLGHRGPTAKVMARLQREQDTADRRGRIARVVGADAPHDVDPATDSADRQERSVDNDADRG